MSRFKRLILENHGSRVFPSFLLHGHGSRPTQPFIPTQRSCLRTCNRFLDFYQIASANKILIPSVAAVKFPEVQVEESGGSIIKLPLSCSQDSANQSTPSAVPNVTLMCLSFRASSQAMVSSWSMPFCDAFRDAGNIHVYEVSLIDSWLLCRKPIKNLLLRVMRKSKNVDGEVAPKRRVVYSFGDNYYFRKEMRILNLLTGYIYLLDRFGKVRWQGFGSASPEELSSLKSCTTLLLGEK